MSNIGSTTLLLRVLKRGLIAVLVAALALLVLLATGAFFADSILRAVLERELAARVVPAARIAGPVQLQLHPAIVLTVHDIALSRDGHALLRVPEVVVTVDRDAMLRGQLALESVHLTGVELQVDGDDEAVWRRDRWLRAADPAAPGGMVAIGQVRMRDVTIGVSGAMPWSISVMQLDAGPLATDVPMVFALQMALQRAAPADTRQARVTLAGSVLLGAREFSAQALHGRLALPHPAGGDAPLEIDVRGDALWSLVSGGGSGQLAGGFDRSRFDGHWRYTPDAVPPLTLGLVVDRLDLDAYLPAAANGAQQADLSVWRHWPVEADLSIGELRLKGLVSRAARLRLSGS